MRRFTVALVALLLSNFTHAADRNPPGFCRFAGTISPDSAYEFIWAPTNLPPEARAELKEWSAETKIDFDAASFNFDSYLYDNTRHRVLAQLPDFSHFDGMGMRKNRGEFHVAWAPDSRSAIAICEERWDDAAIVWVEPAENRVTSLKDALEKAYAHVLLTKEKDRGSVMQFTDPALLPGGILVIEARAGHEKEGPYFNHRLTFRISNVKGKIHGELLKARRIEGEHNAEYDPDLNLYYGKLRDRLDEKGRAALKQEEKAWLAWRDKQPEDAREKLTERRAVELRARFEN